MQAKTTRAFRTISEAGEELGLQPHVLRFWESKFADIKPIKRGGGRRFYRPEDIEFLRGIKILLHDEKHPIKDVQKLIRVKGANSVVALGQSLQRASEAKKVKETVLIPERIQKAPPPARPKSKPLNLRPSGDEKVVHFAAKPKEETPLELHEVVTEEPMKKLKYRLQWTRLNMKTFQPLMRGVAMLILRWKTAAYPKPKKKISKGH